MRSQKSSKPTNSHEHKLLPILSLLEGNAKIKGEKSLNNIYFATTARKGQKHCNDLIFIGCLHCTIIIV